MKRIVSAAMLGFVISGAGVLMIFLFARTVVLSCERGSGRGVVCTRTSSLLGILQLGEEVLPGVQRATLDESCDEDGCTYRVLLSTSSGARPLTSYYSSGYSGKERLARDINSYLSGTGTNSQVFEAKLGVLSVLIPLLCIAAGPIITVVKILRGAG